MELTPPHGGELQELLVDRSTAQDLKEEAVELPEWHLTPRQVWDIELLLNGGFSPLTGFLTEEDYNGVVEDMRLADGTVWPMPITLDVEQDLDVEEGDRVALRHPEGMVLAIMDVESRWEPDRKQEAKQVFGTTDTAHPAVRELLTSMHPVNLGGRLHGIEHPPHHTYKRLRHTPKELRAEFSKRGWSTIIGFQTRNPMHRVHVELTRRAAAEVEGNLLIHPVVGRTKPGDVEYFHRVRCYQAVVEQFPEQTTMLSLLPLAMRMGGPREAVWHALVRQNYGCSHFIVGRDHAGPGSLSDGQSPYGDYEAQELLASVEDDLEIQPVTFEELVYVEERGKFVPKSDVAEHENGKYISGTELRRRLREGADVPDWLSYPSVLDQLRHAYPPRSEQGFTVFFTGLSGSGKSTIAKVLHAKLMEDGSRPVTLLDGDHVRKTLSSELGFSREHRALNVRRTGFVAREITKNRGIAIAAHIAPYRDVRSEVREMIEEVGGGFQLVHVDTPLEVCEERDRKGLYAQARKGIIDNFTGISDPYQEPAEDEADIVVDTTENTADECAHKILLHLESQGFLDGFQ